jgi:hypothetical protein
MRYSKKIVILILVAASLFYCGSKQNIQFDFEREIADVYFQQWIVGQQLFSSRTNFYIQFKKPLSKEIILEKIHFQNQKVVFDTEDDQTFVAHLSQMARMQDLILDGDSLKEYGNRAPVIIKSKFDLKRNEAVLEYKKGKKTMYYKMVSIKEKPIITYPLKNKPKN